MRNVIPPLCLVLALLALVAAFALLAFGSPETSVELHMARVQEDRDSESTLEEDLARRQRRHKLLIGSCFATGVLFGVAAFLSMRR